MAVKKFSLLARDVAWSGRSVLNFKESAATRFLLSPPFHARRMSPSSRWRCPTSRHRHLL